MYLRTRTTVYVGCLRHEASVEPIPCCIFINISYTVRCKTRGSARAFIMSLFTCLGFKRARADASPPQSHLASTSRPDPTGSQGRTRRELLRVVLRDTVNRHGIPGSWLDGEVLVSTSRTGERGIHWRLVVKHWDPRLLLHAAALQQALIKRLTTFEPLASSWLTGISWQFAAPDDAPLPAMPHPGSWTEPPAMRAPTVASAKVSGGSGDVIAGPALAAQPVPQAAKQDSADLKADLEHLFAVRDGDFQRHRTGQAAGEDATQPMFLSTEPAKL